MRDIGNVRQVYRGVIVPASASTATPTGSFSETLASQVSKDAAFESAVGFVLKNKRGYVPGENPMKYGIMQTTLKDYDPKGRIAQDVSQLDEAKAKQIYRKIWERAGCDKLPYPLNVIHFDTYVHRPRTGVEALKRAQGNPQAYLDIRKSLEEGIKGYEPTRTHVRNRVDQLAAYVKMNTTGAEGEQQSGTVATRETSNKKKPPSHFDLAANLIFKHEGKRLIQNDNGKGPARFGILQTTLKELDPEAKIARDVADLDESKAKQIYKKIWYRAGCDKLDYPLNIIHFDTFMHRPNMALETLDNSDGDPQTYLELRQTALRGLRGYKKYGASWESRIRNLTKLLVPPGQAAEKRPDRPQVLEQGEAG